MPTGVKTILLLKVISYIINIDFTYDAVCYIIIAYGKTKRFSDMSVGQTGAQVRNRRVFYSPSASFRGELLQSLCADLRIQIAAA